LQTTPQTTLEKDLCRKCGTALEQTDKGRDKKFAPHHRRSAEYERKRVQNALEDLEGRERWGRKALLDGIRSRAYRERELQWYRSEIECLEARLLELCE
jgi:hypothetical protein